MVPGPQCHGGQNMVSHQKFVAGDETVILNTVKHVHFAETLFPENFHFFAGIKLCHSKYLCLYYNDNNNNNNNNNNRTYL